MGMEGDCCGSGDFTNTPAGFIEGQANLFPTLFWKENFNDLTISKENQITFNQILNRENELKIHFRGALNLGISREKLEEMILHVAHYSGFPTGVSANQILNEIVSDFEKEK